MRLFSSEKRPKVFVAVKWKKLMDFFFLEFHFFTRPSPTRFSDHFPVK